MLINKEFRGWRFRAGISPDWGRYQAGWRDFEFCLIKIHTDPPEGAVLQAGRNYRGIMFRIAFWLPFEVKKWR